MVYVSTASGATRWMIEFPEILRCGNKWGNCHIMFSAKENWVNKWWLFLKQRTLEVRKIIPRSYLRVGGTVFWGIIKNLGLGIWNEKRLNREWKFKNRNGLVWSQCYATKWSEMERKRRNSFWKLFNVFSYVNHFTAMKQTLSIGCPPYNVMYVWFL